MDLGFFRRARQGFADRFPATLDYGVLVATLAAAQSTSVTARSEAASAAPARGSAASADPLVAILLGQGGWREAVAAQGGCFNANEARAVNLRKPI